MRSPGRVEQGEFPISCSRKLATRELGAALLPPSSRAFIDYWNSNWRGRRLRAVARGRPKKSSRRPNDSTEAVVERLERDGHGQPRYAGTCVNAATRFPICTKPERLPPSRPRLFGAAEFRPGAPHAAAGSCCGSRISTRQGAGRNSRRRSTKTSPGWGYPGKRRCGGNRNILRAIGRRSKNWQAWA